MRLALSLLLALVLVLGLAAQTPPPAPTPLPSPAPAAAPAPAPKVTPIPPIHISAFNQVLRQFQSDVEILRLRACADVGLHHSKCIVRWDQGIVEEPVPPSTPGPLPQTPTSGEPRPQ